MDRLFIDTDVILDFLTGRQPFALQAAEIFFLAEKKEIKAFATALSFANAYYVLRKLATHKKVLEKLKQLVELVNINGTSKSVLLLAMNSDFNDFEDALQHFSAMESPGSIIITRNIKDYKHSELAVLTPEIYLKQRRLLQ